MGPAACNTEIGILRVACQGGHSGRRLGCLEFSSMGSGGEQARTPATLKELAWEGGAPKVSITQVLLGFGELTA